MDPEFHLKCYSRHALRLLRLASKEEAPQYFLCVPCDVLSMLAFFVCMQNDIGDSPRSPVTRFLENLAKN